MLPNSKETYLIAAETSTWHCWNPKGFHSWTQKSHAGYGLLAETGS